jgi:hypothetical protein
MLEFRAILIELLSKFRLDATSEMEGDVALVNPSLLLRPKGGLNVKISRLSGTDAAHAAAPQTAVHVAGG